ncbi:hypothetical protein [Pseudooceanicola sp. HF7]|uniref:hypothetical protein n=1 Tax=Pseudooceanicola sp. HF7 TaxID=2721560 RepID=UPI001C379BBE|nr:hypothetical protein [Pseudooceanicola sp. HF7]
MAIMGIFAAAPDCTLVQAQFWDAFRCGLPGFLGLIQVILAIALLAALIGFLVGLTLQPRLRSGLTFLAISFAFSVIALTAGFSSANSRSSAVGDILPVLLGGAGTLAALSLVQNKVNQVLALWIAVAFSMQLLVGFHIGSLNRSWNEDLVAQRKSEIRLARVLEETGDATATKDATATEPAPVTSGGASSGGGRGGPIWTPEFGKRPGYPPTFLFNCPPGSSGQTCAFDDFQPLNYLLGQEETFQDLLGGPGAKLTCLDGYGNIRPSWECYGQVDLPPGMSDIIDIKQYFK